MLDQGSAGLFAYSAHHELSATLVVGLAGPSGEAAQQDLVASGDQRRLARELHFRGESQSMLLHQISYAIKTQPLLTSYRGISCLLCLYGISKVALTAHDDLKWSSLT